MLHLAWGFEADELACAISMTHASIHDTDNHLQSKDSLYSDEVFTSNKELDKTITSEPNFLARFLKAVRISLLMSKVVQVKVLFMVYRLD
ncbi:hypothetical protein ES288_D06G094300v1 [Gossypium darwinii]|uniref:Uncharacterized protein n=1 Tax=Gossypium darwinii TaxID=34276 RepID=A0A5D2C8M1_GOSDA|nr:hypothetical protein ES288_D06G094300v1 [Gossypium darwinii]